MFPFLLAVLGRTVLPLIIPTKEVRTVSRTVRQEPYRHMGLCNIEGTFPETPIPLN